LLAAVRSACLPWAASCVARSTPKKRLQNVQALGFGRRRSAGRRFNAVAGNARLAPRIGAGSHRWQRPPPRCCSAPRPSRWTMSPTYRCACVQPRRGHRAEVRILAGEQLFAPGVILRLHQPAGFAHQQPQRVPSLRGRQGLMGQVGVGWAGRCPDPESSGAAHCRSACISQFNSCKTLSPPWAIACRALTTATPAMANARPQWGRWDSAHLRQPGGSAWEWQYTSSTSSAQRLKAVREPRWNQHGQPIVGTQSLGVPFQIGGRMGTDMSTATSHTRALQRKSPASIPGEVGAESASPRTVPRCRLTLWFTCTTAPGQPAAAQGVAAEKPREGRRVHHPEHGA
jgi:hypothetical protein